MAAVDEYLSELVTAYETEPIDRFHRRLASWRGGADHTVLLFALLMELRALRAALRPATDTGNGR